MKWYRTSETSHKWYLFDDHSYLGIMILQEDNSFMVMQYQNNYYITRDMFDHYIFNPEALYMESLL